MSDNDHDYLRTEGGNFRLTADVTALMLKGAGYAALFCLVIGLAYAVLIGISNLLPEDSKFAPDPTPMSMQIDATEITVLA
ncbi:RC-LH1 core complex protein PufX [Pseudooctadecabacter jejudonensis]|uniref:Intrinsic membrane protein PufX n=1 Tax=Pseudooctadecabacter jejudonensis TaxID=1391910 RepID=A0A1Y5S4N4_9RHOB|nr:RC-LH1 core complex protein PufX [Pseudooctadecabacter jejudonensis]SLN32501.1 Intrinsic membrane protein PufX [Pseudooctadecabacter jejudonensis]